MRVLGSALRFARGAGPVSVASPDATGLPRNATAKGRVVMRVVADFSATPAFELRRPLGPAVPLLIDSPHSGRAYPAAFLAQTRLDARAIRRSEDAFVDDLVAGGHDVGAWVMTANFPRAFLDLNREPLELDPRMFVGHMPAGANTRSTRVAGGLGTIPRIVSEREEIYGGPMPIGEALERVDTFHRPYHALLRQTLEEIRARFGAAILIDCHSMPSTQRGGAETKADMVLGDRLGDSCDLRLTDLVSALLRDAGYRVARNKPYAGGFITEHYGQPHRRIHALQIEISRALYMDEATIRKTARFETLKRDLTALFRNLGEVWPTLVDRDSLAAE